MLDELKAALINEDKEGIESEVERLAALYNLPVRSIRAVKPIYDTTHQSRLKDVMDVIESSERHGKDGIPDKVGVSIALVQATWYARGLEETEYEQITLF